MTLRDIEGPQAFSREHLATGEPRLRPGPRRALAAMYFALRRLQYRLRYGRRLRLGRGVMLIGRLSLRGGTRLELGDHVRVRRRVIVNGGGVARVGAHTLLNGCWLGATRSVTVGDWCLISDCDISDSDFHNLPPRLRHHRPALEAAFAPVVIGRNAWVGARAMVLKGVHVGDDSVVGAGAVVREDVPAGVVVAGNPARVVKTFRPDQRTSTPRGRPAR